MHIYFTAYVGGSLKKRRFKVPVPYCRQNNYLELDNTTQTTKKGLRNETFFCRLCRFIVTVNSRLGGVLGNLAK